MEGAAVEGPKQSVLKKIGFSTAGAIVATTPLSMGVTVFDRSVIQYANGSAPSMAVAVKNGFSTMLRSPIATLMALDTRAVCAVYVPTYITKNTVEALSDYYGIESFWPVFLISTTINTTLGVYKDKYLATMYGSGAPNFPRSSLSLFVARDAIIVGASFNGPLVVSPILQDKLGMSAGVADTVAQLACPGLAQIFATPLHLIGLDLYNRPDIALSRRLDGFLGKYFEPLFARMARQVYVFGIGGILIKKTNNLVGFYEPTEQSPSITRSQAEKIVKNRKALPVVLLQTETNDRAGDDHV